MGSSPVRRSRTGAPYYLLIVGDPGPSLRIPVPVDVERAVGRIASAVVAAETTEVPRRRRKTFFAPRNPDEAVTSASTAWPHWVGEHRPDWETCRVLGDDVTKRRLAQLLDGPETPDFLCSPRRNGLRPWRSA